MSITTAASLGEYEQVEQLLQDPTVDVNAKEPNGYTPLNCACWFGHVKLVKRLLSDPRVDVNLPAEIGETPLFVSVQRKHPEIIKLLLAHPRIKVNQRKNDGATAFLYAAQEGLLEESKTLLADPRLDGNIGLQSGVSPMFLAARRGNLEVIKYMLAMLPDVTVSSTTYNPINEARKNGYTEISEMIKAYVKNKERVKFMLRVDLFPEAKAADIFVKGILLNDKYIYIKDTTFLRVREKSTARFYKILISLPLELQMLLVNIACQLPANFVPSESIKLAMLGNFAYYGLVLKFQRGETTNEEQEKGVEKREEKKLEGEKGEKDGSLMMMMIFREKEGEKGSGEKEKKKNCLQKSDEMCYIL